MPRKSTKRSNKKKSKDKGDVFKVPEFILRPEEKVEKQRPQSLPSRKLPDIPAVAKAKADTTKEVVSDLSMVSVMEAFPVHVVKKLRDTFQLAIQEKTFMDEKVINQVFNKIQDFEKGLEKLKSQAKNAAEKQDFINVLLGIKNLQTWYKRTLKEIYLLSYEVDCEQRYKSTKKCDTACEKTMFGCKRISNEKKNDNVMSFFKQTF